MTVREAADDVTVPEQPRQPPFVDGSHKARCDSCRDENSSVTDIGQGSVTDDAKRQAQSHHIFLWNSDLAHVAFAFKLALFGRLLAPNDCALQAPFGCDQTIL